MKVDLSSVSTSDLRAEVEIRRVRAQWHKCPMCGREPSATPCSDTHEEPLKSPTHQQRQALQRSRNSVLATLRDAPLSHLLERVVLGAGVYFEECPNDFVVHHAGEGVIIFGNINRLLWTPATGYTIDDAFCSVMFVRRYRVIGRNPSGF